MSFDHLFSSERLIYRALEKHPEEKAFFHNIINNDPTTFAQSMNRLLRPLSSDDVDKIFGGASDALLSVRVCLPASEDGESKPTTIGWLSLDAHPVSRHHRSCELGITLATPYQGKGYGTEAITWALDWAFRVAGVHAVRLGCFSFNERALRLYDRLGFARDGVDREAYYYDFKWHDRILFSMLESEWAATKNA